MSLEMLDKQYSNYKFACDMLGVIPFAYDADGSFLVHYKGLCDREGVNNSLELHEKLKLFEVWE